MRGWGQLINSIAMSTNPYLVITLDFPAFDIFSCENRLQFYHKCGFIEVSDKMIAEERERNKKRKKERKKEIKK